MQQDRMAKVYIRDRREDAQARAFDALGKRLSMLLGSAEDSGSPMASANSPTCGHPKLGQARTAGL
jgi:hypothetical protein